MVYIDNNKVAIITIIKTAILRVPTMDIMKGYIRYREIPTIAKSEGAYFTVVGLKTLSLVRALRRYQYDYYVLY